MRVVFVQGGLGAGGAEKIVNLLACHYAARGHEVHVLSLSNDPKESFFAYPGGIEVHRPPDASQNRNRLADRLGAVRWLRSRFRELQPDVVVSFLTRVNALAALASWGLAVPLVVCERNNPQRQLKGKAWRWLDRFAKHRANRIVMQTRQAAATLAPSAASKAFTIPNPYLADDQNPTCREPGCHFVAVGRLQEQKGFDLLLNAFARVNREIPEARLTVYGDGRRKAELADLCRTLELDDRVCLAGKTAAPGEWMKDGQIFVLSSRYEGFPNVLLEAMGAGFAAVSFDCPWGPSDIIDHEKSGLLVPDRDVDGLANAMLRVAGDHELQRRLAVAGSAAVQRFDRESILRMWDRVVLSEETREQAAFPRLDHQTV